MTRNPIFNAVRDCLCLIPCLLLLPSMIACGSDDTGPNAIGVGDQKRQVSTDAGVGIADASDAILDAGGTIKDAAVLSTGGSLVDTKGKFPVLADAASPSLLDSGSSGDGGGGGATEVDSLGCLVGGTPVLAEDGGDGSCAAPFRIDLSSFQIGDVVELRGVSALGDEPISGVGKCGALTTRDVAILVTVPADTDLEVSVDGDPSMDSLLLALPSDPSTPPMPENCGSGQAEWCVDIQGAGGCEYMRLREGDGLTSGKARLFVSEELATNRPLTLRFRVQDPRSGL